MNKQLHQLSDVKIEKFFADDPLFGGVFCKDQLPPTIEHKAYILNLDNHTGAGTHWTLISYLNPMYVLYVDSFGCPPPEAALKFMRTAKKVMFYSDLDIQSINSDACGWYCMYIIEELQKGRSIVDILMNDFGPDPKQNEQRLLKYKKKILV